VRMIGYTDVIHVDEKPAIRRSACNVVHGSQVSEMPT